MKENDYARFVPKAPVGSVLSFLVLNDVLENNYMDLAFDILNKYIIDDLNDKDYPIITAAARYGNRTLFEKLIALGANINALTHVQSSAVGRALAFQNYEGVRALIELGFEVKSYSGGKALRSAAWDGELEIVRLLVEHGADVNFNGADQVFPYCTTPVQMAASRNYFEIVKYLVEQGADVTIRDKHGNRAFLEAKRNKNTEMMEYIKMLEPPIWHEADKRVSELKKMGMPTDIIKWLGTENRRIDLPETCPTAYIDFETIFDVKPIQWQGRVFLDITKEVESYEGTGFIIWIPDQKCLGSLDIEHQELITFKDVKWNKFNKRLPIVVNHLLNGLSIDELYK
ncbi:ankyrin repeat domain-containing protein [Cohnella sp. REN36]|uniref:ankyrin repeat domain-containing protein n=1 Tax=Cohnella sp. REN36 TaxID=2887347 RepID=UPI001D143170|nr:ankyrin repeat domain-containing protein [Cohnella sp. REN36]MCC3373746.1 ankyrin repeat domain-containing protein [Cohnella sp. REN36]